MKYIKLFDEVNIDWNDWEEIDDDNMPDNFIGHEKFYQFLVDNGCLDEWILNMNKRGKDIKKFLDNCRNFSYEFSKYITLGFVWAGTKNGQNYWHAIYKKGLNFKEFN